MEMETVKRALLEKFRYTWKPFPADFSPGSVNVAIHARRGDVVRGNPRRVTVHMLAAHIELVTTQLRSMGMNYTLHILSQGADDEFSGLVGQYGARVHVELLRPPRMCCCRWRQQCSGRGGRRPRRRGWREYN